MAYYDDPALDAVRELRERRERTCPSAARVATAAVAGPVFLAADERHHLLRERCATCESHLAATWRGAPPADWLLRDAATWPPAGAMRAALEAHVATCDHPGCQAFAAPERIPPVSDTVRAKGWLERMNSALLGRVRAYSSPATQLNAPDGATVAGPRRPSRPGELGRGLTLTAGDESILVEADAAALRIRDDRAMVVVVFLRGAREPLASITLDPASGVRRGVLPLDPALLAAGDLRVALGVADA